MNVREMDSARGWFQKFQPRVKTGPIRKNGVENVSDEAPSNATKQKAEAAKQYIENHYKSQMKCLQDRKER
jgi:serine/threonine kinase 38